MDVKLRIGEVLRQGRLMSLATIDESGPWVSDLIYIHDDSYCLYWISRLERRHSKALSTRPEVALSITIEHLKKDLGLQMEGTARRLTSAPSVAAVYWKKRGAPKVPISDEHAWYQCTPTKIELLDEVNFGVVKQLYIPT